MTRPKEGVSVGPIPVSPQDIWSPPHPTPAPLVLSFLPCLSRVLPIYITGVSFARLSPRFIGQVQDWASLQLDLNLPEWLAASAVLRLVFLRT